MRSAHPLLMKETAILRRAWENRDKRLRFTKHARDEMVNDSIIEADVRYVIARNGVRWVEWKQDQLWHVDGGDIDGRSIRVVLTVYEIDVVIKVVTVMVL